MSKLLNERKVIRKFWNIKNIFKAERWQKRNITTSNYWDMSPIGNNNVVTEKRDI